MSIRMLIVDPDWHFFRQARDILESRGHHVVSEPRLPQAVQRARRWRPEVVMVSAELPACCDGDLLERLTQVRPRPAILLLAALDRFANAWQAWQRGGDELLFKPILDPVELHLAVLAARENALFPGRRRLAVHLQSA